jgi:hypothetical protein
MSAKCGTFTSKVDAHGREHRAKRAAAAAAMIAETRAEQGARCLDGIHKGKTWLEAKEIMIEMYSSLSETRSDPEKYWRRWAWRVRWDEGFAKEMETLD